MKNIKWRYALGEILIVIIGVTIAFSMNKCAEHKRDLTLKEQYLESLKNDIESDKLQLERNVVKLNSKASIIDTILIKYLNSDHPELGFKILSVSNLIEFNPKDITYNTLINSGDFKLLNDLSLKTRIEEHFSKDYKRLERDYERMENIHKKYLGDYYINYINYDDVRRGKLNFENKDLLRNILYSIRGALNIKITSTQQSVKSCDTTLATIKDVLEGT